MNSKKKGLSELTRLKLQESFLNLDIEKMDNLYELTMEQVELALVSFVLDEVDGNQAKAAKVLGLSRNTLKRKKDKFNL